MNIKEEKVNQGRGKKGGRVTRTNETRKWNEWLVDRSRGNEDQTDRSLKVR